MPIPGIFASAISGNLAGPISGYDALWATTLIASTSSITISNIPQTYKHLQLRVIGRSNRASNTDTLRLQANNDTASDYTTHGLYGDGSTAAAFAEVPQAFMQFYRIGGANAGTNTFGSIVIDILDYQNTNKFKTARGLGGSDNNGNGEIYLTSGLWRDTSAITSVSLFPGVGTTFNQYSSFALYGIN